MLLSLNLRNLGNINIIIKKIPIILFLLFIFSGFNFVSSEGDLLDKAFGPSINQQGLINLGQSKDAVGNEILRGSITINLGGGPLIQKRAPLIVRIAKLLLRMTIVLSVSMILYNGILYIIQSSKGETPKDPQKNLMNIGIGILLALSSLGIINLINSITISSLKTSDDLGGMSLGCNINGSILVGDSLREYICLNSSFDKPANTMEYRIWEYIQPFGMSADKMDDRALGGYRCKICENESYDCKRKRIKKAEMKSKCVDDFGGVVME